MLTRSLTAASLAATLLAFAPALAMPAQTPVQMPPPKPPATSAPPVQTPAQPPTPAAPPASPTPAPQLDTMSGGLLSLYRSVRRSLLDAADLMPDADYGFKPAPGDRTFAELVGHVANLQYALCAPVVGGAGPRTTNNELVKTKTELVQALTDAMKYCDKAYDAATDATLADPATFEGLAATKGYLLAYNVAHDSEHYGNIATYLRLKGIPVPGSAR